MGVVHTALDRALELRRVPPFIEGGLRDPHSKCLLVLTVGLNGLFCALQNVANFRQAKDALAYVISGSGHETYPHTLFFYSNSSELHTAALIVALVGEFAVGFFGLKGAWDLFAARNGTANEFHAAKTAGVWAGGIALLTWFGLFVTIGGAFFEMWQTPMGSGSQDHAFDFAAISAITILFVYRTDDRPLHVFRPRSDRGDRIVKAMGVKALMSAFHCRFSRSSQHTLQNARLVFQSRASCVAVH